MFFHLRESMVVIILPFEDIYQKTAQFAVTVQINNSLSICTFNKITVYSRFLF